MYRALPLLMGWDFGLTPAVIFGQMTPRGQLRIIDELVAEDMGIASFVENVVKPHLTNHYNGMKLISDGDPAGNSRAQTDEDTCLDVLKRHGILTQSARTNNFIARRESVVWFLSRMIDGQPGFLLSPQCRTLRKGFNGGYRYRRLQVPGEERFTDEPDKNRFSHPMDGLQYLCLRQQIPADIKKKSTAGTRGSRDTHGPADSRSGY